MRVLAAMSGGVDSSVAAARMVDAGHEVVGVHLALSSAPGTLRTGSRGCCSRGGRRRRPAGRRCARNPVLRLGFRRPVRRGRDRRLRVLLRARRDPQPVCALQREDQVLGAGGQGAGAGLRRGGHRPLRPAVAKAGCAARSTATRTSPTCWGADRRRSCATRPSRSATPPSRRSARRPPAAACRWPTSPTATTSASSPPATPRRSSARASGCAAATVVDAAGAVLAEHDGVHGFTIGQRKGLGIAGPGPDGIAALRHRHRRRARDRRGWVPPRTSTCTVADRRACGVHLRCRRPRVRSSARCRCAPTAASRRGVAELVGRRTAGDAAFAAARRGARPDAGALPARPGRRRSDRQRDDRSTGPESC